MNDTGAISCLVCGSAMKPFIASISDDRYGCPGVYAIAECVSCGHMTTTPPLTEADLPGLYSQYYPRRNVDFAALEEEVALVTKPRAALRRWMYGIDNQGHYLAKPGEKVLDIGCGSCQSLLEMRALGVTCWGVEADPNVAAIAERYGLQVHIGNIHDVPFPDMQFDLIVLNQVIEHVPDPAAMLQAVKARLAPGGRVVMAFPNAGSIHRRVWKDKWINWHVPYHQNHFNRGSFARLASDAGFAVTSTRTITPNLWTVLQLRVAAESKKEGRASAVWSHDAAAEDAQVVAPAAPVAPQQFTLMRKIRNVLVTRAVRYTGLAIGVGNRFFDALGYGDSFLVVLKPSKR